MNAQQVVLITGATRGIGAVIAQHLHAQGYRVFGTGRNVQRRNTEGYQIIQLDVGQEESVQQGVQAVIAEAGRIDALVNNVGSLLWGAAEETSLADLQQQLETNFYGAVRMIRTVLPHMHAQAGGKIINISSIGGLVSVPFTSAYAASKHALEGYSEALRYELLPQNIYVSLVEPGGVRTDSLESSNPSVGTAHPLYVEQRRRTRTTMIADSQRQGLAPERIAAVVAHIIAGAHPQLRYAVGSQARNLPLLKHLLPQRIFERFVLRQFQLES